MSPSIMTNAKVSKPKIVAMSTMLGQGGFSCLANQQHQTVIRFVFIISPAKKIGFTTPF